MPNEQISTFTLAEAVRVLEHAGSSNPQSETAGLAFTSHLLRLGYDADTLATAIRRAMSAADDEPATTALYTLDARSETHTHAVERFRQVMLDTIRPGYGERIEQEERRHEVAGRQRNIPVAFMPYVIFENNPPDVEKDRQLARDLHHAADAARDTLEKQNSNTRRLTFHRNGS